MGLRHTGILLLSTSLLFCNGTIRAEDVSAARLNEALQLDLFPAEGSVWDEDADAVVKRLGWPEESRTSEQGSYRLYARENVRVLGARPYSCVLYSDDGKPAQISMVFANKGDFGKFAELTEDVAVEQRNYQKAEREKSRALKNELREFDKTLKADAEAITAALNGALGTSTERATFGQSRDMRERVQRWNWNGSSILLATPRDEYVVVRIMPAATADAGGRTTKITDEALREMLRKRVEKRPNGDIIVTDIPMVDQGPKGFCVPATWERYLRYLHIPADMYVLAMAGSTNLGGGTSLMEMAQNVDSLCRQYGRRVDGIDPGIDARNLAKYIDEGLPIMWACYVNEPLEINLSRRKPARAQTTDWEAWKKELDPFRAQAKSIHRNPRNGHLRMIIGYNPETREVAISDSWGPKMAERWMTFEEANATSMGMLTIVRW